MTDEEITTLKNVILNSIEPDEKRVEAVKKLERLAKKNIEAFDTLIELINKPILAKDKNEIISIIVRLIGYKFQRYKKEKNKENEKH